MRFFLILYFLIFFSCKTTNQRDKKYYFEYDEIIHFKTNFNEDSIRTLYDNQTKSETDSIKLGVILENTPSTINDTLFISSLGLLEFTKTTIAKDKFKRINEIFREKELGEISETSCIHVYRDILVFKKNKKTIGVAKICFACMANQIVGTHLNTDNFGQSGDYGRLNHILTK